MGLERATIPLSVAFGNHLDNFEGRIHVWQERIGASLREGQVLLEPQNYPFWCIKIHSGKASSCTRSSAVVVLCDAIRLL